MNISNNLNNTKAAKRYPMVFGTNNADIRYPQNSSITIWPLSLPRDLSASSEVHVPREKRRNIKTRSFMSLRGRSVTNKRASREPNVPGAFGR